MVASRPRIILDTHVLIWSVSNTRRLTDDLRRELLDLGNDVFFTPVSVWEAAIKYALGRSDFQTHLARLIQDAVEAGFIELPVSSQAAARVAVLPRVHRDPFDRLLIAQALEENAILLTSDHTLLAYGSVIRLVDRQA